jgi:hypothetical protein
LGPKQGILKPNWLVIENIPKGGQVMELKQLFNKNVGCNNNTTLIVEGVLAKHACA